MLFILAKIKDFWEYGAEENTSTWTRGKWQKGGEIRWSNGGG